MMVRVFVPDLHAIEQKKISYHSYVTVLRYDGPKQWSIFIYQHNETEGLVTLNSVPHRSAT